MSAIEIEGLHLIDEDEAGAIRLGDIYIPPPYKLSSESNGTKSLIMVQIVNNNFKSFYGEVTLGPFHDKFTSIIGPNGSGKSNVIDALMFVFGSRANKIRSKKLSALIHNSAQHKNIESCSVSIHYKQIIRDGNGYQDVLNSNIIVSRTIFKDNSGFYKLNDEKVPYKVIFQLFKELGIDLNHNRFLILQGEVEQIALMKCKARNENETGMLEYLEDIIGTSRYNVALKKLQCKVDELSMEKTSRCSNVEITGKELEDCKKPRDNAIEFYRSENQITYNKNKIFQKKIFIMNTILNKTLEKKNTCSIAINNLKEKFKSNDEVRNQFQNELKGFKKEMKYLISLLNDLEEKFNKLNRNDIEKGEDSKNINKNRKKLMEKVQLSKIDLEKMLKQPKNNAREIAEFEVKIKALNVQYKKESEALEQDKNKVNQISAVLIDKRNVLQNEIKPEKSKLSVLRDEYNMLKSKMNIYVSKRNQLEANINSKKTRLENAIIQHEEKKSLIMNLQENIKSSEIELANLKHELQKLSKAESEINEKLLKNRNILNDLQDIDFNRSRSRVLDFLHEKQKEGIIHGFFGRLGDLGGIDNKYDIAISTACGALDNILVDTIVTAQKCVELLKQYNVGRATFIALDKQQHFWDYINSEFKSPENLARLFDLIRVQDKRILPAFYYVTRDTLVAQNLDQATRVAYGKKRFRVVTINGELIELTGTLSGGGNKPRHGLMSDKVREKTDLTHVSKYNIKDVQNEQIRLQENRRDIQQQKDNINDNINKLKHSLSREKTQLCDISKVIKPIEDECRWLTNEINLVEKNIQEDQTTSLQSAVDVKKKEMDEQQAVVDKIEIVLNGVKDEISSSVMGSVKSKQTKVNKLKKEIANFQNQVITLKVATSNNEKKVNVLKTQIDTMEKEIEKCKSQILQLHNEKKEIEIQAQEIDTEKEKTERKLAEIKEKYNTMESKLKILNKKDATLKGELLELENELAVFLQKIETYSKEIAEINLQKNNLVLNDSTLTNLDSDPFATLTDDELREVNVADLQSKIDVLENNIKRNKLEPNSTAIEMYNLSNSKHKAALEAVSLIIQELDKVKQLLKNLEERKLHEFMTGFGHISMKCREFYRMLSLDGDADLDLVDCLNPFTKGITLNIRPPKKSWRSILQLSGGEKTLSSLAFVFAVHHFRPSPFYLMDEIDAALDMRNVSIVGHLIRHLSQNTQFIVISLSEAMFKLCNRLIGICKVNDCTGTLMIRNVNQKITAIDQINLTPSKTTNNRNRSQVNKELTFRYTNDDCTTMEVKMKGEDIIEEPVQDETGLINEILCTPIPCKKPKIHENP